MNKKWSKAKRTEEILKKARKLILKKGHDQVSLRAIAKEAKLSPSSLYEYFDGIDQLLKLIQVQILHELSQELQRSQSICVDINQLGMAYINFAISNPKDYMLVFHHQKSGRKTFDQKPMQGQAYAILLECLSNTAQSKKWRIDSNIGIEGLAFGFWSLLHGQVMLRLTHLKDFEADFDQTALYLITQFTKGLESR